MKKDDRTDRLGFLNVCVTDRQTDRQTDRPTDGHDLLQKCEGALKNEKKRVKQRQKHKEKIIFQRNSRREKKD